MEHICKQEDKYEKIIIKRILFFHIHKRNEKRDLALFIAIIMCCKKKCT